MSAHEFRKAVKEAITLHIEGNDRDVTDNGVIGLKNTITGHPQLLPIDQYHFFVGQLHGLEHALDIMDDVFKQMHSTENVDPFTEK